MMVQYVIVKMPLNGEGKGPEMDPSKVRDVVWEVWNMNYETVGVFNTETEAEEYLADVLLKGDDND